MAEWIDVNDRLPDSSRYVWVTVGNAVLIDWHDVSGWGHYDGKVIAWMEIGKEPEPYKPVDVSEHECCDCDHYRGRVLGETYCRLYGCVTDACDAWEEVEDR